MKRWILFIILLARTTVEGQVVTFDKNGYRVGESIKANVSGGLIGVENDIINSSFSATDGQIDLKSTSKPGFYRINFKFLTGDRLYLLAVLPSGESFSGTLNFEIDESKKLAVEVPLQTRIFNYFKQSSPAVLLNASRAGLNNFCAKNVISVVANASFCITSVSGGVVVLPICKSLTQDNLEALGVEMSLSFFTDMRNKGFITADELTKLVDLLDDVDFAGILDSNCSLLFKNLQKLADSDNAKIALGYFEQQCKTTVLIVETFRKVP
ncbi:hypothetical protein [Dyadobacter sp. OTU695]|uniref:hypothetical protein n=1 Tax=Dyadobacter sp. OTU695 TaxID=3043860 RepID=UPI00313C61EF